MDDNIARKIVRSLDLKEGDNLIEIGPGQGALTKHFAEAGCNFAAVELDKEIYNRLKKEYKGKVTLIHKDFLKLSYDKDIKDIFRNVEKIKIAGNIPYNITTEILFKIFGMREYVSEAVLMMQKEVARRLTAKIGTKDYGILAINTELNSVTKVLFDVPPTAFFPKPRVHSSMVSVRLEERYPGLKDRELFTKVVRESFGQRRKVMRNSLKNLFEKLRIPFGEIEFDFSRRPESVSAAEFVKLSNEILDLTGSEKD